MSKTQSTQTDIPRKAIKHMEAANQDIMTATQDMQKAAFEAANTIIGADAADMISESMKASQAYAAKTTQIFQGLMEKQQKAFMEMSKGFA